MWAAMNGHTKVVKALIKNGADVKAKEKVRRRFSVNTRVGANDQRMFGSGLPDLGAAGPVEGRKCPMYRSCARCHEGYLTIVLSCARNVLYTWVLMTLPWCYRT
jgi:hypothetical protein